MSSPMTQFEKDWIDGATYEQLLREWRYAPFDHPLFTGETGYYFQDELYCKEAELSFAQRSEIGARVGWNY